MSGRNRKRAPKASPAPKEKEKEVKVKKEKYPPQPPGVLKRREPVEKDTYCFAILPGVLNEYRTSLWAGV
jgi:hypothetical protein